MYIWNKKALEQKLIADSLTEREKFSYVFALIFSYVLGGAVVSFMPSEISETSIIGQVTTLVLTAIGIIWCFRINQSGDAKNFVERFICISWVTSVRVVGLFVLFILLMSVVRVIIDPEDSYQAFESPSIVFDILMPGAITIIYYWRIAASLATIARVRSNDLEPKGI